MPTAKMPSSAKITLRELAPAELPGIYPLLTHMNPDLSTQVFKKRLKTMLSLGYQVVAAFEGKKMVGLSGFWIGMRFWCGKQFDIDNFVVDPAYRGRKIGEKLLGWLEKKAITEKCDLIVLDTYADLFLAHRFYHRHGFSNTGYHMTKIPGSTIPYTKK